MNKLITIVLIAMLLSITYAVTYCTPEYKYYYMTATAYCPCNICCGKWADGLTYTEDVAGRGCVAIDPVNGPLKLGQRVFVVGYGEATCNDIGGAIIGWRIDLCYDEGEHYLAKKYGVELVKVYVLEVD